jgi:1-hydroxycarotenoid 3,4-desaturase
MRRGDRVVIIGAGVGGLACAYDLAARGLDVTVLERAAAPGGKMREVMCGGHAIDAGPTVLTMRFVFESLFADHGDRLSDHVTLQSAEILARHAWSESEQLDLFADLGRSADAIAAFAGASEAKRYLAFCARARSTYETLESPFMLSAEPTPLSLARGSGLRGLSDLWRVSPFTTLWSALGNYFHDPRLRQLFGRYATYCGSSPFAAPATLMLVAHVEQAGVWLVDGGMHRLATAIAERASAHGAIIRYGAEVETISLEGGRAARVTLACGEDIEGDAVVSNADVAALASGRFGAAATGAVPPTAPSARSLSAVTWAFTAEPSGFQLQRHNVFFSRDYRSEFDAIFRDGRLPDDPTVYVCAQDRSGSGAEAAQTHERFLCLVNAPPSGDTQPFVSKEIESCRQRAFAVLRRCGLEIEADPDSLVTTTPENFEALFPATGGALYGKASHGWTASFSRPTARTRIPGLYVAGGSTHPGPGVPMATLSGRLAAASIIEDLTSASRSRKAAMFGGTSMA